MKPDYIKHAYAESALTVDWFYGHPKHHRQRQLWLTLIGWLVMLAPVVFIGDLEIQHLGRSVVQLFNNTLRILSTYGLFFAVVFLMLFIYGALRKRHDRKQALVLTQTPSVQTRVTLAENLYVQKYGSREFRLQQPTIIIRDYADVEF